MATDPLLDPGEVLRDAAARPRRPVDPEEVLARAASLRRRRAALGGGVAVAVLVPLAVAALTFVVRPTVDLADADPYRGGPVPSSLEPGEDPPGALADGRPAPEPPDVVARRFTEPVRSTARLDLLPDEIDEVCRERNPLTAEGPPPPGPWRQVQESSPDWVAHLGPETLTTIAALGAATPPGYPDAIALVCIAQHDGRWRSQGLAAEHLFAGWTGYADATGGDLGSRLTWVTAFPVPSGAAWAVQEHPGWWLAYEVAGTPWMLAQTTLEGQTADVGFPGARVVFVDADGRVLADERKGTDALGVDAPYVASQAAPATIDLGDADDLHDRVAHGPILRCHDEVAACVWLVEADGALLALSAAGPHPKDTPPLGFVAWCPAGEGHFQGTFTGTVYSRAGELRSGPLTDLHRYEVVLDAGRAAVDLSAFSFGAAREPIEGDADLAGCTADQLQGESSSP